MRYWLLSSVVLVATAVAAPSFAADFEYSRLVGSWKVDGVAVPNEGVQALVDNDPQYMGAVVEFGASQIKWTKGTKAKPVDPSDDCAASPTLKPWKADPDAADEVPIEGGFIVMCGSDEWGTVVPVDEKTVKLYWYDNGVLKLARE